MWTRHLSPSFGFENVGTTLFSSLKCEVHLDNFFFIIVVEGRRSVSNKLGCLQILMILTFPEAIFFPFKNKIALKCALGDLVTMISSSYNFVSSSLVIILVFLVSFETPFLCKSLNNLSIMARSEQNLKLLLSRKLGASLLQIRLWRNNPGNSYTKSWVGTFRHHSFLFPLSRDSGLLDHAA